MFDIMGSVGASKTSVIEQLVSHLREDFQVIVLNGDLATNIDQERILQYGTGIRELSTELVGLNNA